MNCKPQVGGSYGRLVVRAIEGKFATCVCECGQPGFVCRVANLKNGTTKSCGCLRREVGARTRTHGQTKTALYKTWQEMLSRCGNPDNKSYTDYGGRGISVCDRWAASFLNFAQDMGARPGPAFTIDRKDNNGNYEPGNCRWATKVEQTRNRRNAVTVTLQGTTKPLKVWCEELGINYFTAHRKIRREGKDPSLVLPVPSREEVSV